MHVKPEESPATGSEPSIRFSLSAVPYAIDHGDFCILYMPRSPVRGIPSFSRMQRFFLSDEGEGGHRVHPVLTCGEPHCKSGDADRQLTLPF
jgi:hypothetical protein